MGDFVCILRFGIFGADTEFCSTLYPGQSLEREAYFNRFFILYIDSVIHDRILEHDKYQFY
jgi:hypothetical protein